MSAETETGWTGGNYSLLRALLAATLAVGWLAALSAGPSPAAAAPFALSAELSALLARPAVFYMLAGLGLAFALPLGFGVLDRPAAALSWLAGLLMVAGRADLWHPGLVLIGWLLLAHLLVPPAPYGSWAARGRIDPAGDWRLPAALYRATGWLLVATYAVTGASRLAGAAWVPGPPFGPLTGLVGLGELAAAALLLLATPRLRPAIWLAALVVEGALLLSWGETGTAAGLLLLHLAASVPVVWLPPRRPAGGGGGDRPEMIFYDGHCGLCHRLVRFVLAEDTSGRAFRFAPLGGEAFGERLTDAQRAGLPDTVVVLRGAGAVAVRSRATAYLAQRLGGAWRLLGALLELLPARLADAAYDLVARVRHRLFPRPEAACPLLTPELRERFDS